MSKKYDDLKKTLQDEKSLIEVDLKSIADPDKKIEGNWRSRYPMLDTQDLDEEAQAVGAYDTEVSLEHQLENRLADVNHALEKIEDGKFGVCECCGKEIPHERLVVNPAARFCVNCMKDDVAKHNH